MHVTAGVSRANAHPQSDDWLTLCAIGAAAASLSAVAHEALGHGGGCLAVRGTITLLTSIFFRCQGGTYWTDLAGPLSNLTASALAFVALVRGRWQSPARVFLFMVAAFNAFWFGGQLMMSGLLNTEDLAFVARDRSWPELWRVIAFALGAAVYVAALRGTAWCARRIVASGQSRYRMHRLGIPYVAGMVSAVIAGLLWRGDPVGSAQQAILTFGVAPIGIWFAAARAAQRSAQRSDAAPIERSPSWIVFGALVFVLFAVIQGRGIGRFASADCNDARCATYERDDPRWVVYTKRAISSTGSRGRRGNVLLSSP